MSLLLFKLMAGSCTSGLIKQKWKFWPTWTLIWGCGENISASQFHAHSDCLQNLVTVAVGLKSHFLAGRCLGVIFIFQRPLAIFCSWSSSSFKASNDRLSPSYTWISLPASPSASSIQVPFPPQVSAFFHCIFLWLQSEDVLCF